jgi:hypothetical protein
MSTTPSLKVIKSRAFKGGTKLWSNRYHFNGGTPADGAHWTTLSDAVVTAEKAIFDTDVTIVETTGYAAGSDVPVFTKTYSTVGTCAAGGQNNPGEVAALARWSTTARTSKNHPIYLFNYWHGARTVSSGTDWDKLDSTQKSAMNTYGAAWISGFSDGTHTLVRAGPNGATATAAFIEEYVTHRDFPYSRSA